MSEWIRCPKCGALMTVLTSGHMCPCCGYRVPAQTVPVQTITFTYSHGTLLAEYVKVVRCKDCKHHEDEEPGMVYCPNIVGSWVKEDGYCFMAERKEE